jgi:hypothetical protein
MRESGSRRPGRGPADVVMVSGPASHVNLLWNERLTGRTSSGTSCGECPASGGYARCPSSSRRPVQRTMEAVLSIDRALLSSSPTRGSRTSSVGCWRSARGRPGNLGGAAERPSRATHRDRRGDPAPNRSATPIAARLAASTGLRGLACEPRARRARRDLGQGRPQGESLFSGRLRLDGHGHRRSSERALRCCHPMRGGG